MLFRREVTRGLLTLGGGAGLQGWLASPALSAAAVTTDPSVGPPWPASRMDGVRSRDGTNIVFRSAGDGDVTVLLVHGWSCNHHFFRPQFAALAERYRVLAPDLAGHGLSGPREAHSVPAFANDVQAVAAAVEGPLVLVVHSAGGRVACAAADLLGDRLLGIVGVDSLQNLGMPAPDPARSAAALAGMRSDFAGSVAANMRFFFPPDSDAELVAWVQEQMTATNPAQAIAAVAAYADFDEKAAIAGFARPVIALNSDGVPTDVEAIRQLVPNFEARIFPGQGHFLHLAHWESFNQELLKALTDIERLSA